MIEIILTTLLWTYIGVAALLMTIFILALIRIGGFAGYAELANKMFGEKRYTETNVQWFMFFIVLGWPLLVIGIMISKPRQVK